MKDNRWNIVAFLLLRITQLVLGVIVMGMTAYFVSKYDEWYTDFTLATSLCTLAWIALSLTLFSINKLVPLAAIIVDALFAIAYIVCIASIAHFNPDSIGGSCTYYEYSFWITLTYTLEDCTTLRGLFGILVVEMLMFVGATIWDGIVLYQNRNGPPRDPEVVQYAMHSGGGGGVGVSGGQIGGTYGMAMSKPMMDAGGGGDQTYLPRYQPTNSPIYPVQAVSPPTPYNPYMSPPMSPTMPQQAVVMQHQDKNHQQQHQQPQQQNQLPPQELSST
ncbi:hypothetical protein L873DRAFT_1738976 [Choiromyces venosus 120613-1]|uniref:MARVEL domain-containing protein n=1 Tax=Choiromyces venosus 120613-1 TaxID=1336337 RepID=A0A3N4JPU3_9PEZI|nr:hypothetical protein L873DRAFT_1738976 [Choiromyces venosus 120613-1]